MKKIKALFKVNFQKNIYFRSKVLIIMLVEIIPIFIFIFVWSMIFKNYTQVAGLNLNQMISYYFILTLVRELVYTRVGKNTLSVDIYSGQLAFLLLKPLNILQGLITEEISCRSFQTILFLPVFLLTFFIINNKTAIAIKTANVPIFIFAVLFSFLLSAFLDFICGLGAFWLVQTHTLFHIKEIFYWILGGIAFPQNLLPVFVQKINLLLPFYYIFAFPIEILTRNFTIWQFIQRFSLQIVWLIILAIFYQRLLKKGLKKYESWGN